MKQHMRVKVLIVFGISLFLPACASQVVKLTASPIPTLNPATPTTEGGCISISTQPTPTPDANSMFPPSSETDFSIGPQDAPITLIEYCDFQAPICRSMAAAVSNLFHNHPNKLRFVFRPVPAINQLDKSLTAVQAALAASEQGKFWEMYDVLFQKHLEWDGLTVSGFKTWNIEQAKGLGLDVIRFKSSLDSQATMEQAKSLNETAVASGLRTFPLVLINGKPQPLFAIGYDNLEASISLILLGERQFTECPPFNVDRSKQYIATLRTEKGDVVIELFADKAPMAVNSFVFLARQGWFDGVTFHRVIPGFAAQTGDPSGTGKGNPGYFFKNESNDLEYDKPGVVGMANSGRDTNGSQFFITYAPEPHLNGGFTIFGQVIKGMEVLEQLTPRDPEKDPNLPPGDKLISVQIEEE
jgi:cyclophilin family peptidyl-prolyl cis-trans isomerase/protein-disulfide isomerase